MKQQQQRISTQEALLLVMRVILITQHAPFSRKGLLIASVQRCRRMVQKAREKTMYRGRTRFTHGQCLAVVFSKRFCVLVWMGENDVKTVVWTWNFCYVFSEMDTEVFENVDLKCFYFSCQIWQFTRTYACVHSQRRQFHSWMCLWILDDSSPCSPAKQ